MTLLYVFPLCVNIDLDYERFSAVHMIESMTSNSAPFAYELNIHQCHCQFIMVQ
jgi:hypothetical protein